MFDIGFWELSVIGVIGLLVLGPERLPGVARVVGGYIRKARTTWAGVRSEIAAELAADEFKEAMQKPAEEFKAAMAEPMSEMESLKKSASDTINFNDAPDATEDPDPAQDNDDTDTVADDPNTDASTKS
ncbi:MAG: Sec-independent protein translocase protein TatB [Lysobacterales bacterium]